MRRFVLFALALGLFVCVYSSPLDKDVDEPGTENALEDSDLEEDYSLNAYRGEIDRNRYTSKRHWRGGHHYHYNKNSRRKGHYIDENGYCDGRKGYADSSSHGKEHENSRRGSHGRDRHGDGGYHGGEEHYGGDSKRGSHGRDRHGDGGYHGEEHYGGDSRRGSNGRDRHGDGGYHGEEHYGGDSRRGSHGRDRHGDGGYHGGEEQDGGNSRRSSHGRDGYGDGGSQENGEYDIESSVRRDGQNDGGSGFPIPLPIIIPG